MRYFKISVVLLEILYISFINLTNQRNVFSWEKIHILFKLQKRKFSSLFQCATFSFSFFSVQFFTIFVFKRAFSLVFPVSCTIEPILHNWRESFTSEPILAIPEKVYFVAVFLHVGRLWLVRKCNEVTHKATHKIRQ